jgi:Translation initiation factor 2 (IF-2; GTPase)
VLLSAPGEITETDVDLASASGAVIVGFNTSMAPGAKRAADATGVDVRDYDVIYKLLEDIQLAMEGLLEPELVEEALGEAEVRAVFTIGRSAVAGCYVTSGKLQRNCKVRVWRGKEKVFEGDLDSLRRNKDDVKEVGHWLRVRHRHRPLHRLAGRGSGGGVQTCHPAPNPHHLTSVNPRSEPLLWLQLVALGAVRWSFWGWYLYLPVRILAPYLAGALAHLGNRRPRASNSALARPADVCSFW